MKPSKDLPGGSLPTDKKLILTEDGSPTLYSTVFDATYHSLHGAIQESIHVFIKSGLAHFLKTIDRNSIRIFEMGFGTGLNAYLTALMSKEDISIEYHSVEKYPVSPTLVNDLISPLTIAFKDNLFDQDLFKKLHSVSWGEKQSIKEGFDLHLYNEDILSMTLPEEIDLYYFDAFGPGTQPELWGHEITSKFFAKASDNACLVTYSAQGAFRRSLITAGFDVEKIPGPPGKREMIRATKRV